MAVVAESPDDRSVTFRTYCSQRPLFGQHHVRPPILTAGGAAPDGVPGRYLDALDAGDTEAIVATFAPGGYLREPEGPQATHRGTAAPAPRCSPGGSATAAVSACSSLAR